MIVLTKGGAENTKKLLARSNVERSVERAAHAWDLAVAEAVGLRGVWVDRPERVWAFPTAPGVRCRISSPPRSPALA